MILNFPPNPVTDDIFDPGNGIKYKWDGSQWSQLETTLKTIYPIDLDRDESTAIILKDLTVFDGSKDFTYVYKKCSTNTITSDLILVAGGADTTKVMWKPVDNHDTSLGYIYIHGNVPGNNWSNPISNPPPYIYVNGVSYDVIKGSNSSGYHWYYYIAANSLDSLIGTEINISICGPQDIPDDNEFEGGTTSPNYPAFIPDFTFKDNAIGINNLLKSDKLYVTNKINGLTDTFVISNVESKVNGTVKVSVTVTEHNTDYHDYSEGNIFYISYEAEIPDGDAITHFIDLTTITKI